VVPEALVDANDADLYLHFHEHELREQARRRHRARIVNLIGRAIIVAAFLGLWAAAAAVYPPIIVPSPAATWRALVAEVGTLAENTPPSLLEIVLGFLTGSALGIGLGALVAQSRWAEIVLRPYLVVSQAVPKVALAPILVILLGYGLAPKVAMAALIAFFPLLENTIAGLRRVDLDSLRLLQSLGATRWQIFTKLRVFCALPLVFAGLRIAAVMATLGAIVAEFVAGNRGLGALLVVSMGTFSTPLLYATMVVLTALAFGVYLLAHWLEQKALHRYNLGTPRV
jgi:NitT/TauT family transport system permease protein